MPAVDGLMFLAVARNAGPFINKREESETVGNVKSIRNRKTAPYIQRPVLVVEGKLRFPSNQRKAVLCIATVASSPTERILLVGASHVGNMKVH